jgi:mono/diheme cytochrome c family protein
MLRKLVPALFVLAIVGLGVFWFLTRPARVAASTLPSYSADVERGKRIFFAGGCASCHVSQGQSDPTMLGGGMSFPSPFGTFYAPNISPHPTAGIGDWTPDQFATALLKGVSPTNQHYYPAFPYTTYQRMKIEDVLDLFAYMKTLPAVDTADKPHDLPLPFRFRRGLGLWKLLYLDGKPFAPDPSKSAEQNAGAYIVEAMGHCAECHSPRDLLGGIAADKRYAGGVDIEKGDWVPNLTPGKGGIPHWTEQELVDVLTTGATPEFAEVGGTMAAVVRNTRRLDEADRKAIASYIKSLPPRDGERPPAVKPASTTTAPAAPATSPAPAQ